jgi:hypothetical protein
LLLRLPFALAVRKMAGSQRTSPELQLSGTLFHEHWWLSAVTGDNFREVTETAGGRLVGRLPFILARRKGFKVMEMPPFTRVLGPIVEAGIGKPQTRMLRRFHIVGRLLDQLPDAHYFRQLLDVDNHEVQAFLDRGFQLSIENTFRLDCRVNGPEEVWANMRDKTRNLIRKAEGKYTVGAWGDVKEFIRFYIASKSAARRMRSTLHDFPYCFPSAERAARERFSWPEHPRGGPPRPPLWFGATASCITCYQHATSRWPTAER